MRLPILFASLCVLGACTETDVGTPHDHLAGVWDRYDSAGVLMDRVTFDGQSTFTAFANQGSLLGDFSSVVGSYRATDDRVFLSGTSGDGFAYEIAFSFYANEEHFVRGAYVLEPGYTADDRIGRYDVYYRESLGGRFEQTLDTELSYEQILDSGLRFEVIDDRALGQHDTDHAGVGAPSTWWDSGVIYERVD